MQVTAPKYYVSAADPAPYFLGVGWGVPSSQGGCYGCPPPLDLDLCAPWMAFAKSQKGQSEWTNGKNPKIAEYFKSAGVVSDQSDWWCAAFVHWSLAQSGIVGAGINGNAYKDWGVSIAEPKYGAIAIFKTGHVGFYVGSNGSNLIILHGNWSNRVDESDYITPGQIQEYRFPIGY